MIPLVQLEKMLLEISDARLARLLADFAEADINCSWGIRELRGSAEKRGLDAIRRRGSGIFTRRAREVPDGPAVRNLALAAGLLYAGLHCALKGEKDRDVERFLSMRDYFDHVLPDYALEIQGPNVGQYWSAEEVAEIEADRFDHPYPAYEKWGRRMFERASSRPQPVSREEDGLQIGLRVEGVFLVAVPVVGEGSVPDKSWVVLGRQVQDWLDPKTPPQSSVGAAAAMRRIHRAP